VWTLVALRGVDDADSQVREVPDYPQASYGLWSRACGLWSRDSQLSRGLWSHTQI